MKRLILCLYMTRKLVNILFLAIKNIKALATYRGAIAGVKYAEAFQVLKLIDK